MHNMTNLSTIKLHILLIPSIHAKLQDDHLMCKTFKFQFFFKETIRKT